MMEIDPVVVDDVLEAPEATIADRQEVHSASSDHWRQALARVVPAVVVLRVTAVRDFDTEVTNSSHATGFVADRRRGIILTNRHVVNPGTVRSAPRASSSLSCIVCFFRILASCISCIVLAAAASLANLLRFSPHHPHRYLTSPLPAPPIPTTRAAARVCQARWWRRRCLWPVHPIYRDPVHDFGFFHFDPAAVRFLDYHAVPLAPEAAAVGLEIRVVGNDSGEKVSILAGTIARLDRDAPVYDAIGYNDFNTFYLQAASGTKGGSSGSPVIDSHGRAVALNAGSKSSSASAFYLPLDRVVRALSAVQACFEEKEGGGFVAHRWRPPAIPRGTLQVTFRHKGFEETRRLGLRDETEAEVRREAGAAETGLLVVDSLVPGGPADGILESGDVLVRVNGKVCAGQRQGVCASTARCVRVNGKVCARQRQGVCASTARCVRVNGKVCARQRQGVCGSTARCVRVNGKVCAGQRQGVCASTARCVRVNGKVCARQRQGVCASTARCARVNGKVCAGQWQGAWVVAAARGDGASGGAIALAGRINCKLVPLSPFYHHRSTLRLSAHHALPSPPPLLLATAQVLTQFLALETILDDTVGGTVMLDVERGGTPLSLTLSVHDLHAITPRRFLELSGGVLHALSYQQARNFRFPCGPVYVAEPGYMLTRAGVPRFAIIQKLANQDVPDLDAFIRVFARLQAGARVPIQYVTVEERHQAKQVLLLVDRHAWYAPPQMYCRDDSTGLWHIAPALPPPPVAAAAGAAVVDGAADDGAAVVDGAAHDGASADGVAAGDDQDEQQESGLTMEGWEEDDDEEEGSEADDATVADGGAAADAADGSQASAKAAGTSSFVESVLEPSLVMMEVRGPCLTFPLRPTPHPTSYPIPPIPPHPSPPHPSPSHPSPSHPSPPHPSPSHPSPSHPSPSHPSPSHPSPSHPSPSHPSPSHPSPSHPSPSHPSPSHPSPSHPSPSHPSPSHPSPSHPSPSHPSPSHPSPSHPSPSHPSPSHPSPSHPSPSHPSPSHPSPSHPSPSHPSPSHPSPSHPSPSHPSPSHPSPSHPSPSHPSPSHPSPSHPSPSILPSHPSPSHHLFSSLFIQLIPSSFLPSPPHQPPPHPRGAGARATSSDGGRGACGVLLQHGACGQSVSARSPSPCASLTPSLFTACPLPVHRPPLPVHRPPLPARRASPSLAPSLCRTLISAPSLSIRVHFPMAQILLSFSAYPINPAGEVCVCIIATLHLPCNCRATCTSKAPASPVLCALLLPLPIPPNGSQRPKPHRSPGPFSQVVFLHPVHNIAFVAYDPAALGAAAAAAVQPAILKPAPALRRGDRVHLVALSGECQAVMSRQSIVTNPTTMVTVATSDCPRYRAINMDVVVLDTNFGVDFPGVLADDSGAVRALWSSFSSTLGRRSRRGDKGGRGGGGGRGGYEREQQQGGAGKCLLVNGQLWEMPQVRVLEAELVPMLLSKARSYGLSDRWVQVLARADPVRRQVLRVKGTLAGSAVAGVLQQGDMLLAVNGRPVTCFADVEAACCELEAGAGESAGLMEGEGRSKGREGAGAATAAAAAAGGGGTNGHVSEMRWREPTGATEAGVDTTVVNGAAEAPGKSHWLPALARTRRICRQVDGLGAWREVAAGEGVEHRRVSKGMSEWKHGSPGQRYGVSSMNWIVEINGRPVPDLDALVTITQELEHGAFVRVKLVDLDGEPYVLTLKQDLHYWPTWELRFVPSTGTWQRTILKTLK
ncbi:unnamed protein product [Closterium sp. Naga37s-1]|nr:unnamed protein product [Closterium sp. Naga37s-1]